MAGGSLEDLRPVIVSAQLRVILVPEKQAALKTHTSWPAKLPDWSFPLWRYPLRDEPSKGNSKLPWFRTCFSHCHWPCQGWYHPRCPSLLACSLLWAWLFRHLSFCLETPSDAVKKSRNILLSMGFRKFFRFKHTLSNM